MKNASVFFWDTGGQIPRTIKLKDLVLPFSVRKLDFGRKRSDDIEVVPAGATH